MRRNGKLVVLPGSKKITPPQPLTEFLDSSSAFFFHNSHLYSIRAQAARLDAFWSKHAYPRDYRRRARSRSSEPSKVGASAPEPPVVSSIPTRIPKQQSLPIEGKKLRPSSASVRPPTMPASSRGSAALDFPSLQKLGELVSTLSQCLVFALTLMTLSIQNGTACQEEIDWSTIPLVPIVPFLTTCIPICD